MKIYKHYKGDLYEVIMEGFLERDGTPCTIYRRYNDPKDTTVWVRDNHEFHGVVTKAGDTVKKFELITIGADPGQEWFPGMDHPLTKGLPQDAQDRLREKFCSTENK